MQVVRVARRWRHVAAGLLVACAAVTLRAEHSSFDLLTFYAAFRPETLMRSGELPFTVSSGGGASSSAASAVELTVGETVVAASEALVSVQSRAYLGFFSRIDPVAPGNVGLAALSGPAAGEITVDLLNPGDDADVGTAMALDLRIAPAPIAESNFFLARRVEAAPAPSQAGSRQFIVVSGLVGGATYYLAAHAVDEALNRSPSMSSASARALTTSEPAGSPPPGATLVAAPADVGEPPVAAGDFIIDTTVADFEAGSPRALEILDMGALRLARLILRDTTAEFQTGELGGLSAEGGLLQVFYATQPPQQLGLTAPAAKLALESGTTGYAAIAQSFVNSAPYVGERLSGVVLQVKLPVGMSVTLEVSLVEDDSGRPTGSVLQTLEFTRFRPRLYYVVPPPPYSGELMTFGGFDVAFPKDKRLWCVLRNKTPNAALELYGNGASDDYRAGSAVGTHGLLVHATPLHDPLGVPIHDLVFIALPQGSYRSEPFHRGKYNGGVQRLFVSHLTPAQTTAQVLLEGGEGGVFASSQAFALPTGDTPLQSSFSVTLGEFPQYRLGVRLHPSVTAAGLVTPVVDNVVALFPTNGAFVSRAHLARYPRIRWGLFEADVSSGGQVVEFFVRSGASAEDLNLQGFVRVSTGQPLQLPDFHPFIQWAAELATSDVSHSPELRSVTIRYEGLPPRRPPAQVEILSARTLAAGAETLVTALVLDDFGRPVIGEPVSFGLAQGTGVFSASDAVTDSSGTARVLFRASDSSAIAVLSAVAGHLEATRRVLSLKTPLGGLGGLPTTDNGTAPHVLNLGNLRNFTASGDYWGQHAAPQEIASFASARREVHTADSKLFVLDFSFKKIFRSIGKAFSSAVSAVTRVAKQVGKVALQVATFPYAQYKKILESKIGQQFLLPALNVGLAVVTKGTVQLNYGPNGWSTTIGFMGSGVTIGERGQFGAHLGYSAGPLQAGINYESGKGFGYTYGVGLQGQYKGASGFGGMQYDSRTRSTTWGTGGTYDGFASAVGKNGVTAGVNLNGLAATKGLYGRLESHHIRSTNFIGVKTDWNGKTDFDFKNGIGYTGFDKVRDLLPKARLGFWDVGKFGSLLGPGGWGQSIGLPKLPYKGVAELARGFGLPQLPKPPLPHLPPAQPATPGEQALGQLGQNPSCSVAPNAGGLGGLSGLTDGAGEDNGANAIFTVKSVEDGTLRMLATGTGLTHKPVNTQTGNLPYGVEDVYLPGGPLFIHLLRFYNSLQAEQDGPLGFGWSFSYGMSILERADGSAELRLGDGSTRLYVLGSDGGFKAPAGTFSTLTRAGPGTLRLAHKFGSAYLFNPGTEPGLWRLARVNDPNLNFLNFGYDASGRLTSIADAAGRVISFLYNAQGRVASLSGPMGRLDYAYDASGNLASVAGPDYRASYVYDGEHNLIRYEDPRSQTGLPRGSFSFDEFHRVAAEKDGELKTVASFVYDIAADGKASTTITDALGRVTTDAYDAQGRWGSRLDAAGKTTAMSWDQNLQLAEIVEADGRKTSFTYDGRGNRLTVAEPGGGIRKMSYDPATSALVSETSPSGRAVTTYSYDARGNLTSITDPDGFTHGFGYQGWRLKTYVDPRGFTTGFAYDPYGNVASITDAGGTRRFAYDAQGRLLSTTDEEGRSTSFDWNGAGALGKITYPGGATYQMTYDAAGDLIREVNERGNLAATDYDANGRPTAFHHPGGGTTRLAWDAAGQLVRMTDPKGNALEIGYDALGRPYKHTDAMGRVNEVQYDGAGRVTGFLDSKGQALTFELDAAGRTRAIVNPAGRVEFGYDQDGRLVALKSPRGFTTTFTHTAAGLQKEAVDHLGNRHAAEYDAAGNLTLLTDPAGERTALGYDERGYLKRLRDPAGRGFDLKLDGRGRVIEEKDPLGNLTKTSYDERGFSDGLTLPSGAQWRFEHDAIGNVTLAADPGGGITRYAYNADDLLEAETTPAGATGYRYDANGNPDRITMPDGQIFEVAYTPNDEVKSIAGPSGATRYEYDSTGFIIQATDPNGKLWRSVPDELGRLKEMLDPDGKAQKYAWDPDGNLIREEAPDGKVWLYEYDELDRLIQFTDAAGKNWGYAYDPASRLKTVTDPEGRSAFIAYEDGGLTALVTDPLGKTSRYKQDAADRLTTFIDANGRTTAYEYNPDGTLKRVTAADGAVTTYGYDAAGNLLSVTDALLRVTRYAYDGAGRLVLQTNPGDTTVAFTRDAAGRLTKQIDERGKATSYAYDAAGRLASITDPLGQVTRFEYDNNGNRTKVTDPAGAVTLSAYDDRNRLTRTTDPSGATTRFEYDAAGNQTAILDASGAKTSFAYDAAGRLASQSDPAGATTRFEYDANGNQTKVIDPAGKATSYVYDAMSRLLQTIDPTGAITSFVYDAVGNLLTTTDPARSTTSSAYDAMGRVTTATDALGNITRFAYDLAGNLTAATDPLGRQSATVYDVQGRVSQTTDALSRTTRFEYDPAGNRIAVTDALGNVTRFEYDASGRLTAQIDPLFNRTTFKYDARGNKIEETDPEGHVTKFEYDQSSRLAAIMDALSNRRTFAYDQNGRKTSETDPTGAATRFEYDESGRLTATIDALGHKTLNLYDSRGNLSQVTDPNGNITKYGYDDLGRLVQVIDAENGLWSYSYDAMGRLSRIVDANQHNSVTFAYDAAGRLVSQADALGNTFHFEYDALGNRTKLIKPNAEELRYVHDAGNRITMIQDKTGAILATLSYDALDRMTSLQSPDVATDYLYDAAGRLLRLNYSTFGHALSYTYDKDGLRRSMALAGDTIGYGHDAAHKLTGMTAPHGAYAFIYDAAGRQTSRRFANGATATYAYDLKAQVLKIDHRRPDGALLGKFHYAYDANGNRTSMTDNLGLHAYTYDKLNRLAKAAEPFGLTQGYTYDGVGNRTSLTKTRQNRTSPVPPGQPAQTTEIIPYVHDVRDMLLRAGATSYSFDSVGRLSRIDYPGYTTTFEYDPFDRPRRISGLRDHLTGKSLPDSLYRYAPQLPDLGLTPAPVGVRVSKTDREGTTKYVVDNTGNVALELDQTNKPVAKYLHTLAIDDPVAMTDSRGNAYAMPTDALNSVAMLLDKLGLPVQVYYYGPFGEPNVMARDPNCLKHGGRCFDSATQTYDHRSRTRSPWLGQWNVGDPWAYAAGSGFYDMALLSPQRMNRCAYAVNNPATKRDPSGLLVVGAQVGTLDRLMKQIEIEEGITGGCDSFFSLARRFEGETTVGKYIWTAQGWIDVRHFFGAAALARASGAQAAVTWGRRREHSQAGNRGEVRSAWSVEDAPSNFWGARFGAQFLLGLVPIPKRGLAEVVRDFINGQIGGTPAAPTGRIGAFNLIRNISNEGVIDPTPDSLPMRHGIRFKSSGDVGFDHAELDIIFRTATEQGLTPATLALPEGAH